MDFIEGLVVTYKMKDVAIKISGNLIMPKNEILTGTVRTDKQKDKYTILLIVRFSLILFMVYFGGSLEAQKKQEILSQLFCMQLWTSKFLLKSVLV